MSVQPIPKGYHTLTPSMTVRDAARAIEFYKQAFGAEEVGVIKRVGWQGHACRATHRRLAPHAGR
jgi:PhnB protein